MSIENRVSRIISKHVGTRPKDIAPDDIIDLYGLDSLSKVEIIMELEAEFGMDIDATESEHWETVNDIIEYID